MYAGRIVEQAHDGHDLRRARAPVHVGPAASSIPRLDTPRGEELVPIAGRPPSLINLPSGCSFHPRCPYVREAHKRIDPALEPVAAIRSTRSPACCRPRRAARCGRAAAGETPDRGRVADVCRRRCRRASPADAPTTTADDPAVSGEPLIEVRDLVKHFPIRAGHSSSARSAPCTPSTACPSTSAGRDARPRRRVGLRQVDDRAAATAPAGADERLDHVRGPRDRATLARASSSRCAARCR